MSNEHKHTEANTLADQSVGSGALLGVWSPIASAPKDGTRIKARIRYVHHVGRYHNVYRWRVLTTWWGKASHIPLNGWCHGRNIEDIDLWEPTEWLSPNVKVTNAPSGAQQTLR